MQNTPLVQYSLIGCALMFPFLSRKNLSVPQVPLMIFFTFMVAFSIIASTGWIGGAISFGQDFVQTSFIPFMLINGILSSQKKQYVMFLFIIAAALLMVWNGHVQMSTEDGIGLVGNRALEQVGGVRRITYLGILGDPNDLGMYLVMTIPLIFLVKDRLPSILRLIAWGAIVAILYGIYLTNSRGTLLATLSLLAFWFWRKYGKAKSIYAGILFSPALLFVLSNFRSIDSQDASAQGRLDAWYSGYQMFMSSPLWGVGYRQFMEYHGQTAHNSFVLVFSEMGLIGCLIWVGLLVSTVSLLADISKKRFVPEGLPAEDKRWEMVYRESNTATALLFCFIGFMVSGFFLSRSYIPILYIFLAMASATIGRAGAIFPKNPIQFDYKQMAKLTFAISIAGIIGTYLLVRIGL